LHKRNNWDVVNIFGSISEEAEVHFAQLGPKLSHKVIFNFRMVEYINSCGVRAWINFFREIEETRKIVFEECTPEIVSHIHMIPNFRGNAHIKSVHASYSCNKCNNNIWVLFEENTNLPAHSGDVLPRVECERCHYEMEMEDLEDEFFNWCYAVPRTDQV